MVKYFRCMSLRNLIEYKKLNALFKRRLKKERSASWAETLSPNSSIKDIFRNFKKLNNYRVPNQPNMMFENPKMAEQFMTKLCKSETLSTNAQPSSSNTEEPFTMDELDFALSQKSDSAPGIDGIKYGDIAEFPTRIKEKLLELVNDIWATQNIPEVMKRILMVL